MHKSKLLIDKRVGIFMELLKKKKESGKYVTDLEMYKSFLSMKQRSFKDKSWRI